MKRIYTILFIVIIAICSMNFNLAKSTLNNNIDRLDNEFFFPTNTNFIKYNVDYVNDLSSNNLLTFKIIDKGRFLEGELYELQCNSGNSDFYNRLDMTYFYVNKNEIYIINNNNKNSDKIRDGLMPDDSKLVCSNESYSDQLNPNEKGQHYYIEKKENICEYHFWDNSVESGYYEKMIWEKGKGLIYYQSGYGAGRQEVTYNIEKDNLLHF